MYFEFRYIETCFKYWRNIKSNNSLWNSPHQFYYPLQPSLYINSDIRWRSCTTNRLGNMYFMCIQTCRLEEAPKVLTYDKAFFITSRQVVKYLMAWKGCLPTYNFSRFKARKGYRSHFSTGKFESVQEMLTRIRFYLFGIPESHQIT